MNYTSSEYLLVWFNHSNLYSFVIYLLYDFSITLKLHKLLQYNVVVSWIILSQLFPLRSVGMLCRIALHHSRSFILTRCPEFYYATLLFPETLMLLSTSYPSSIAKHPLSKQPWTSISVIKKECTFRIT